MYLPKRQLWDDEIAAIGQRLLSGTIFMGDYNTHHSLWGSNNNDTIRDTTADFVTNNGLICLNMGESTHISDIPPHRESSLDITAATHDLKIHGLIPFEAHHQITTLL